MNQPPDDSLYLTPAEIYPRQALYGFQLAPDGKRFSFVLQRDKRVEEIVDDGAPKLFTTLLADLCYLPSQGGYPQPLTTGGDYPNPPVWSPDGRWLAVEQDEQLFVMAPDGSQKRSVYTGSLYHPSSAQSTNVSILGDACWGTPRFSPGGAAILIALREENQAKLRLVSADGTWQRQVYACEGAIIAWDWSPDGKRLVCVTWEEGELRGDIRVIDILSGTATLLCQEDYYAYQTPVAAWASNRELVLRSNRSGWSKLWRFELRSSEFHPITEGEWDDSSFRLSPDGRQVVYTSRRGQPGSGDDLWISDIKGGRSRQLTNQAGGHAPLAWAPGNTIYFWHASPTEPGDLWSVDNRGGAPQQLTRSASLELQRKLRAPQEIAITHEEGGSVPTLVYYPADFQEGQRCPAIVWIHGGPTSQARSTFVPYLNWLSNLGFIVLAPNYRGSTGLGVAHMQAVAGEGLGKNDLSDVLAAGRFARELPGVDTRRGVGVGGYSWGGYLTLMAVTQAPDLFSCAYAGAGIADWFIQQAGTEVRFYDRWLVGGWVYEQSQRARERSPLALAGQVNIPLLVLHGEDDISVPFAQIGPFVEKVRQAGAEVEFVSFPLEGHLLRKPENQRQALELTKRFFRRHLQPWNFRDNPSAEQVL
jgi:dipeptidyl aminopeptidase/acylaminoacyl peptidase